MPIKDCYRNVNEFYHYDIKYNDVVIAKAHSLSIIDKTYMSTDNRVDPIEMIIRALDSWEFEGSITKDNINMLKDEYQLALIVGISDHESFLMSQVEGIEKN